MEITTDSSSLRQGDIVLLKWRSFVDSTGDSLVKGKHMFVVLNEFPIVVSPISSQMKHVNPNFTGHILIRDYLESSLDKESYVNLYTQGIINFDDVYKIIGCLSSNDLENLLLKYIDTDVEINLETI